MKKFLKKNSGIIIVALLIVAFVLFTVLVGDNNKKTEKGQSASNDNALALEWSEKIKEDEYAVTVFAASWCSNCTNFHPVLNEVKTENNIKVYWFEMDLLEEAQSQGLLSTFEFSNFSGYPYMFVTEKGEFKADSIGYIDKSATIEFLKNNNVIK